MKSDHIYRIIPERIDSFVKRQANRNIRVILITFTGFILLIVAFFPSWEFFTTLVIPIILIFSVINALIYLASLNQIGNWAKKMLFSWDDKKIIKRVDQGDLNYVNQFAMVRNESKYGSKFNQEIEIIHLDSTKITEKEIIFTSYDYNILTGNGRIRIPCELEHFNRLKSRVLENKPKYKLVSKNQRR